MSALQPAWDFALRCWSNGGWLMIPLLVLSLVMYFSALRLFLEINSHFIIRSGLGKGKTRLLESSEGSLEHQQVRTLLSTDATDRESVSRHFRETRNRYLPYMDRRIRFLAILMTTGPLIGLLGTVTGMLSTFNGLLVTGSNRIDYVVEGISEALVTTQAGLCITLPALVLLALIVQRRKTFAQALARLERYNTRLVLRHQAQPTRTHLELAEMA